MTNDQLDPTSDLGVSLRSIMPRAAVVWSVVGWLAALDVLAVSFINRAPDPSWRMSVPALVEWYLWIPLTPMVIWLGRRFPVGRGHPWRSYLAHAAGIAFALGARGVVYAWTTVVIARAALPMSIAAYTGRVVLGFLPIAAILYGAILVAVSAMNHSRRSRAGAVRAAQLETRLAHAELTALRANLHPHFLFNALHSVGALVRVHEVDAAVGVIAELSDLLRYLLQRGAPEEVMLEEELVFVRRYLAIEQVRFADRLRVQWSIAPGTEQAIVPRLLLQPLVENAIRHGVARSIAAGAIAISTHRHGPWLDLTVQDDGPGPATEPALSTSWGSGLGLATARARLRQTYGHDSDVVLDRAPEGGAIAKVRLPYRLATVSSRREAASA